MYVSMKWLSRHVDLDGYRAYLTALATEPVDATSTLPDGTRVDGVAELKQYLLDERLEDDIRYFIESEQLGAEVQAEIETFNRLEQKADQGYSVALRAAQNCVPGEL